MKVDSAKDELLSPMSKDFISWSMRVGVYICATYPMSGGLLELHVLGISGSPRVDGNTEIILRHALGAAKENGAEVELVRLCDYKLEPCDACDRCMETKNCSKDDDWGILYQKILESDGVILGSPAYFQGVTAQMKTFIDRIGYLSLARGRKDFAGKPGAVIGVARRSGLENVCNQMINFVTASRMIVPSGGRVFALGREKGEVLKDQEGMVSARYLGEMMVKTIETTAASVRKN